MARLKLDFSGQHFVFSTQLTVRTTDINAGNHLATQYLAEAHARDQLLFEVGTMDVNYSGLKHPSFQLPF